MPPQLGDKIQLQNAAPQQTLGQVARRGFPTIIGSVAAGCAKLVASQLYVRRASLGLPQGNLNGETFPSVSDAAPLAQKCSRGTRRVGTFRRPFPRRMNSPQHIARALAAAFVAGEREEEALVDRGAQVLGKRWRWLRPLVRRMLIAGDRTSHPRRRAIERWILGDFGFIRAYNIYDLDADPSRIPPNVMRPSTAAASWNLEAPLLTAGELADWFGVSVRQLEWFANVRRAGSQPRKASRRHYRYRLHDKKFGKVRLIEAPKPRLKGIQRQILTGILNHIPPHDAAHGFRRGRSIATFAAPHVGRQVVVKLDLEDFFPSVAYLRIQALFRTIGFPETVADLLAALCSTQTPGDILAASSASIRPESQQRQVQRYAARHLPQGAPTSPALANLCGYRLDCRLAGLAAAAGAAYTRYADDLAFSGDDDFRRSAERFALHAAAIIQEEGFHVHHRKTRVMRQGVCQRIAGLSVNEKLNPPRVEYDRLKAILTNCIRHGPESQNRDKRENFRSHLEGKTSYFEAVNPAKGERLRLLLNQITWTSA